jgi:hypothetical protein
MRIYVINRLWSEVGIFQGGTDCPSQTGSGSVAIKGSSEPYNLGVNAGPAFLCVIQLFKDEHSGPFADYYAVPIFIERATGFFRVLVTLGQRLIKALPHQAERIDLAFRTAHKKKVSLITN